MKTNSVVTLFRFNPLLGEYTNAGCFDAWVYKQNRTRTDSGGTYLRHIFDVRIPCEIPKGVAPDDLICFDKITVQAPQIENCCRIAAVTQNTFGSCPHWHLEAENQYR